jgi:hypothetical protein
MQYKVCSPKNENNRATYQILSEKVLSSRRQLNAVYKTECSEWKPIQLEAS